MNQILVLGAGFVAAPLVSYLSRVGYQLTVASQFLHEAVAISHQQQGVQPIELDVSDASALAAQVRRHQLVVSFVPFIFHEHVAEVCIDEGKHLVTASYETERMRQLDARATEKGIIIVNEIGLDPGIDHLSAMKIFDEIHANGEQLESFVSWCGGIPAPSANNNPLGYKFSWSPKSVLLALLNDARYIRDGEVETIPADQLLEHIEQVSVSDELTLEGYANRDSTSYVKSYHIQEASKVLRGTLRYPGFACIMQSCKALNLLDTSRELIARWQGSDWLTFLDSQTENGIEEFLDSCQPEVRAALEFLDMLTPSIVIPETGTVLDAFCSLLTTKLAYQPGEADMVVMQHQFDSLDSDGVQRHRTSTLILEGDPDGFSAMAKTVGTPAAIAVDLILTGKIERRGVILPLTRDFYVPILTKLAEEGIEMRESEYTSIRN